jgi:hypothetical protein
MPDLATSTLVDCVDFEELLLLLTNVSACAVPIRLVDISRASSSVFSFIVTTIV